MYYGLASFLGIPLHELGCFSERARVGNLVLGRSMLLIHRVEPEPSLNQQRDFSPLVLVLALRGSELATELSHGASALRTKPNLAARRFLERLAACDAYVGKEVCRSGRGLSEVTVMPVRTHDAIVTPNV